MEMENLYKMAQEYRPTDEGEEYKLENYKELSGYPEEKAEEKYSMDDYITENKKEMKNKPAKEEYKMEDDSKYGTSDEVKYDDEEDSKYKAAGQPALDSYTGKEESEYGSSAGSKEDSYAPAQPPTGYSNDDFYKQEDEYKPTREDRKYWIQRGQLCARPAADWLLER